MRRLKLVVVSLLATIFLVGCGGGTEPESGVGDQRAELESVYKIPRDNDSDGSLEVVRVDGVRCIVYDGMKAGGISCDWNGAN